MRNSATTPSLARTYGIVKSPLNIRHSTLHQSEASRPTLHQGDTGSPFSSPVDTMIHHKVGRGKGYLIIKNIPTSGPLPYGVSSASRLLSPSLFIKKYDCIKRCLQEVVGLTDCQVEGVIRLLRIQAYYGVAYPKASQIASNFEKPLPRDFIPYPGYVPPKRHHWGTSQATYWRAIRILKELGLITVINRYVMRPHAQISNLYKLDRLLLLIVRYLAEHGAQFYEKWLKPYLQLPGSVFWGKWVPYQESRAAPSG